LCLNFSLKFIDVLYHSFENPQRKTMKLLDNHYLALTLFP